MAVTVLKNFTLGTWHEGTGAQVDLPSAISGDIIATFCENEADHEATVAYGRRALAQLQALSFHERAGIVKALAAALVERKDELYTLSEFSGATRSDSWIDIEGGALALSSMSSKARRELPDDFIIIDGDIEPLSKTGNWSGQHIYSSMQGVCLQLNAYNFPIWGMLEKLAPALIAGTPVIVKPATPTAYLCEHAVRIMVDADVLPEGALQLIIGPVGNIIEQLGDQDIISFTGSAETARKLKSHPNVLARNIRFVAEQDSLNSAVLSSDISQSDPEFDAFIREVAKEMTVKAGQKCTAIRRILVPAKQIDKVQERLTKELQTISLGDVIDNKKAMGALVGVRQKEEVLRKLEVLKSEADIVFGHQDGPQPIKSDERPSAYMAPTLLRCNDPLKAQNAHSVEAFGPVATLMPYKDMAEAIELVRMGGGSLVASLYAYSAEIIKTFVIGTACFHGRLAIINRDNIEDNTGHGSPLPVLVHGGPGRAGGGEELGGVRAIKHYMQRTAIQGSPAVISNITNQWVTGSETTKSVKHPFRYSFEAIEPGISLETEARVITLEDIEQFAHFTGDIFYAHMNQEAAEANPFFGGRVAHGYLILSFAAGLFVDPSPGPVLANFGLEKLRFLSPVKPGDAIKVRLTAKSKKRRNNEYGEVKWDVHVTNQDNLSVATYELLTMNAMEITQ